MANHLEFVVIDDDDDEDLLVNPFGVNFAQVRDCMLSALVAEHRVDEAISVVFRPGYALSASDGLYALLSCFHLDSGVVVNIRDACTILPFLADVLLRNRGTYMLRMIAVSALRGVLKFGSLVVDQVFDLGLVRHLIECYARGDGFVSFSSIFGDLVRTTQVERVRELEPIVALSIQALNRNDVNVAIDGMLVLWKQLHPESFTQVSPL